MSESRLSRPYVYGLDLRSIGLFRIAAGLTMLLDVLFFKLPAVREIYSPVGFFKNYYADLATADPARPFYLNLFHALGSETGVRIFFVLCGIIYLLYAMGLCTRLLAPLSFLLFSMIRQSNPLLQLTPDLWFLFMLFFAMFLPQGDRFNFFRRGKPTAGDNECRSFPAFALLAAVALVYFTNGYTKLGGDWFTGEALRSFVLVPTTQNVGSQWLAKQPTLLVIFEYATVLWELLVPAMLFLPWFNRPLRLLTAATIIAFHYGNLPFIFPGYYCIVATCVAAILLPDTLWDRLPFARASVNTESARPPAFSELSRSWKVALVFRAILLSLAISVSLLVNLDKLPPRLGLAEEPWGTKDAIIAKRGDFVKIFRGVELFNFLIWEHAYYPHKGPQVQMNLVVFGRDEHGLDWNLVTGDPPIKAYWGPTPDYQRPLFSLHRGAYFNPAPFKHYKIFDRWLERIVWEWNEQHPHQKIVAADLGRIQLDASKDTDEQWLGIEILADWQEVAGREN